MTQQPKRFNLIFRKQNSGSALKMVAFCLVILIPINYEAVVQLKSGGLAVFHFADEKLLIAAKKKRGWNE